MQFCIKHISPVIMMSSNGNISALLSLCAGNSPVPVNSPHKGQWRGALICARINDWVNNREASDLRRHRGHHDVNVMKQWHVQCNTSLIANLLEGRFNIDMWPHQKRYFAVERSSVLYNGIQHPMLRYRRLNKLWNIFFIFWNCVMIWCR